MLKKIVYSLFIFVLIACGESSRKSANGNVQNGNFIDSAVSGLTYKTATHSGTTDSNGKFQFQPGETMSFSLYGQQIISVASYTTLTPFDTNDNTLSPDYHLNLIRFLMAIDTDSNPNNGITIPTIHSAFNINFNQNLFTFETDPSVLAFLTTYAGGNSLPTIQNAIAHFTNSVSLTNDPFVFNFTGKAATSVITNTYCTNNFNQGWNYSFGTASVTMVGDDSFNTNNNTICTGIGSHTLSVSYTSIPTGEFLDCAPSCTYSQLNRVTFVASDADGRSKIVYSWHTPGTNTISNITRIVADPAHPNQPGALSTFKEILTFN